MIKLNQILGGVHLKVSINDILTNDFLQKYTDWKNFNEFEQNSPLNLHQEYYWQYINKQEFNQYVALHSKFTTWNALVKQATKEFLAIRLGFKTTAV